MNHDNLANYLNNHLAGAVAVIELVKQAVSENSSSELGKWLERFLAELEDDRETVRRILREIGSTEHTVKKLGAWVLEKMATTRLSDMAMAGGSPHLRRVLELEAMLIGTHGRRGMWRLLELFHDGSHESDSDYVFRQQRAERQAADLEALREQEAAAAFTGETSRTT